MSVLPARILGRRVRAARLERGWSQKDLCQKSGISARFLVQVENGEANPSLERLLELAGALEVSLVSLLAGLGPADAADRAARIALGQRERIALVGLRGAGKTTIGRALADRLECPFVQLDREVEDRAGMRASEVFEFHGGERFREIARAALEAVLSRPGAVVLEVGGSLVADPELYERLRGGCLVAWLRAAPEAHLRRVREQGDLRPMEGRADPLGELRAILRSREPLYALADLQVDTEALGVDGAVEQLARALPRGRGQA